MNENDAARDHTTREERLHPEITADPATWPNPTAARAAGMDTTASPRPELKSLRPDTPPPLHHPNPFTAVDPAEEYFGEDPSTWPSATMPGEDKPAWTREADDPAPTVPPMAITTTPEDAEVQPGLEATHPVFNRLTSRYTLEALFRGLLAFAVVGGAVAIAILTVMGHGIRKAVTALPDGSMEEKIIPMAEDPLVMLVVGSLTTLAATIVTHYFKATDRK